MAAHSPSGEGTKGWPRMTRALGPGMLCPFYDSSGMQDVPEPPQLRLHKWFQKPRKKMTASEWDDKNSIWILCRATTWSVSGEELLTEMQRGCGIINMAKAEPLQLRNSVTPTSYDGFLPKRQFQALSKRFSAQGPRGRQPTKKWPSQI